MVLNYHHGLLCTAAPSGNRRRCLRCLAARALEPAVEQFKGVMERNPEYAEAKDLIQQVQRVQESAFEELLRKVQLMGRTAFKDALKLDPSLWVQCEDQWGRGYGYRDRVATENQRWFSAPARQEVERELFELLSREWGVLLRRLSSLIRVDETEPCVRVDRQMEIDEAGALEPEGPHRKKL